MKFRKKPVVIEAVQFTGTNCDEIEAFAEEVSWLESMPPIAVISTPEGTMYAEAGCWIIKGVKGEFYPCKDEVFKMTYEPASEATS